MLEKSFFGLTKPRMKYGSFQQTSPAFLAMPMPKKATFLIDVPFAQKDDAGVKIGDSVKTGQKLSVSGEIERYAISSVTGTVIGLSEFIGEFGRSYTTVTVDVADKEEVDDQFKTNGMEATLENALAFLASVPGNPPLSAFTNPDKPIHTIVVCGVDHDLLVNVNRHLIQSDMGAVAAGIRALKQISGVKDVMITVSEGMIQGYGHIGATVKTVEDEYPAALPPMMMQTLFNQVLPVGKTCEDLGVCFIDAEAVASIGRAFDSGSIPVDKLITVFKKDGAQVMVTAKIGTPVIDIIQALKIDLKDKDRIIFGGPLTGSAIYSPDYPIQTDTDAIVLQDSESIIPYSDSPCINCGECIRACPVNVPINMLVRFLEAGQYEVAADEYDLHACIECGLCSFVCVSRIPIFQYIRLAKHELDQNNLAEAANV